MSTYGNAIVSQILVIFASYLICRDQICLQHYAVLGNIDRPAINLDIVYSSEAFK